MGTNSVQYLFKIINALVLGSENMGQDSVIVRYYNKSCATWSNIYPLVEGIDGVGLLYHQFDETEIKGAYEPFLDWIKEIFEYQTELNIDEFLAKCRVYPLHRSIFKSYIETGVCKREEAIIIPEIEYEKAKFFESIINILTYGSTTNKLIIVLDKIHLAGSSTIELIEQLIKRNESRGVSVLCTYDDSCGVESYVQNYWSRMFFYAEDKNILTDMGDQDDCMSEEKVKRRSQNLDYKSVLQLINNMTITMALDQAQYYLQDLFQNVKIQKISIPDNLLVKFYELFALVDLYNGDYHNSLLTCDKIRMYANDDPKVMMEYYFIVGLTQTYMGQISVAENIAQKVKEEGIKLNDDYSVFKAELLFYIARFKGFKDVLFDTKCITTVLSEEFISKVVKYNYLNHLAYIYVFGCENKVELFSPNSKTENHKFFIKALDIISKIKNDKLLMGAYKKNAVISSIAGNSEAVEKNYKKCIEILRRLKNKEEEANIYNGLGYNRMLNEDFEQANVYFNEAISIYYELNTPMMVSESLYNMSINAMMSEEYKMACQYITTAINILNNLHIYRPRICNMAKLYDIAAICNCKLGNGYKCQLYIEAVERMLSHILHPVDKQPIFDMWDDELCLYYVAKGMAYHKDGEYERAISVYKKAEFHMRRSEGSMFITYPILAVEASMAYQELGDLKGKNKVLHDCLIFCERRGNSYSIEKIKAAIDGDIYYKLNYQLELNNITVKELIYLSKRIGAEKELELKNKDILFLANWQEMFNGETKSVSSLIDSAMTTLQNSYGLDKLIYISVNDGTPVVSFSDNSLNITDKMFKKIIDYFNANVKSFVCSKTERGFDEYREILEVFNYSEIHSFIAIPIVSKNVLCGIFITYLVSYENFAANKIILTDSNLMIFKFAMRQLVDEVFRLNTRIEIDKINSELKEKNGLLENLAVTDTLTGLLNRQGFNKIVDEDIDNKRNDRRYITVLYLDLDNFKYCNDTFGHDIGDLILVEFSELLKETIGESGYAVRYGGDEFVIVTANDKEDYGICVAESIFKQIELRNSFVDIIGDRLKTKIDVPECHKLSCSIGIAVDEKTNVHTISDLLKCADEALYSVKKSTKHDYRLWTK